MPLQPSPTPWQMHVGAVLLALLSGIAQAETREEAAERRRREAAERRDADLQAREERRALAAQRRASAADARAERDARREELRRRREEAPTRAGSRATPERAPGPSAGPAPAPPPAPPIPGQPTDAELRAVLQSMINREYNQPALEQARRCNNGTWRDADEQQFCQGWFMAERYRKGHSGDVTMTVMPITVSSLTVRECTVSPADRVYRCLFSMQVDGVRPFNAGPMPGMTMIDVVRSGAEWRQVAGR
jgi:hypothetical protein